MAAFPPEQTALLESIAERALACTGRAEEQNSVNGECVGISHDLSRYR
jgi:hypothetical protein